MTPKLIRNHSVSPQCHLEDINSPIQRAVFNFNIKQIQELKNQDPTQLEKVIAEQIIDALKTNKII